MLKIILSQTYHSRGFFCKSVTSPRWTAMPMVTATVLRHSRVMLRQPLNRSDPMSKHAETGTWRCTELHIYIDIIYIYFTAFCGVWVWCCLKLECSSLQICNSHEQRERGTKWNHHQSNRKISTIFYFYTLKASFLLKKCWISEPHCILEVWDKVWLWRVRSKLFQWLWCSKLYAAVPSFEVSPHTWMHWMHWMHCCILP